MGLSVESATVLLVTGLVPYFAQVRSIQLHRLTSCQDKQNKAANEIAISHIKPRDEAGSFWIGAARFVSVRGRGRERGEMSKIIGAALLAAALAVAAYGQTIPDDRIVGCYVGTWANYRFVFQAFCQSNFKIVERTGTTYPTSF